MTDVHIAMGISVFQNVRMVNGVRMQIYVSGAMNTIRVQMVNSVSMVIANAPLLNRIKIVMGFAYHVRIRHATMGINAPKMAVFL